MAAAVSTPSGAPPMPKTAWTPVPRIAAEMPAERSPSPISRMRAPAARMSCDQLGVALPVEHHDRQLVDVAAEGIGDVAEVLGHRGVDVDPPARRRPDHDLVHVGVRGVEQAAPLGGGQHRDRARRRRWRTGWCPPAGRRRCPPPPRPPLVRLLGPALQAPDLLADVEHRRLVPLALADHHPAGDVERRPARRASPRRRRGPSPGGRPRPMVLAAATAARSVTRMKSCSKARSRVMVTRS